MSGRRLSSGLVSDRAGAATAGVCFDAMADDRDDRARFGLVFVFILATLIISAWLGDLKTGRVLTGLAATGALLLSLQVSGVRPRIMWIAVAVAAASVALASVAAVTGPHSAASVAAAALLTLLIVASPVAIVRRLVQDRTITLQTAIGALCVYLLIGLFFSSLFSLMGAVDAAPVFVQVRQPNGIDYVYFSYVTLTTVGYGDLTPAGNLGKMLSVTEALIGQLYLVSVVALVVGHMGQTRRPGALRGRTWEEEEAGHQAQGPTPP